MIIIGHPWIASPTFKKVFAREEIDKLNPNEIALIEPLPESIELAHDCRTADVSFAITVSDIRNALFANALGASYVVCQQEDAMEIQPIAERYLFDTKVLVLIDDEKEIERLARFSIDGVIFPKAIQQV
jgi:hypothetical protein